MHKRSQIAIIIGLSLSLSLSACVVKSGGGGAHPASPATPPADPNGPPPPVSATLEQPGGAHELVAAAPDAPRAR